MLNEFHGDELEMWSTFYELRAEPAQPRMVDPDEFEQSATRTFEADDPR